MQTIAWIEKTALGQLKKSPTIYIHNQISD